MRSSPCLNCLSAECSIESLPWHRPELMPELGVSIAFRLNVRLRVDLAWQGYEQIVRGESQLPFG